MIERPQITIGVPVRNGGPMLEEMLISLMNQTYYRFQVTILDNASDDQTEHIAKRICNQDSRFKYYLNKKNIGAAPNFNMVFEIEHSTPYYKWAAHDDRYHPDYLESCIDLLERSPHIVLAYPVPVLIDHTREGLVVERMGLTPSVAESFRDQEGRPNWIIGPFAICGQKEARGRYKDIVERTISSFELYGVMRTSVLEDCYFHRSYYGSDKAIVARLALRGCFGQIPRVLYVNNYHCSSSRAMSKAERRRWIDMEGGAYWATTRLHWDLFLAPNEAGLSLGDQVRCAVSTIRHFFRLRVSSLAGRWKNLRFS